MMAHTLSNIGMIGLGVMGKSLTLNLLDHQFHVAGFDLNQGNISQTGDEAEQLAKGQFTPCLSLQQMLSQLEKPRVIALSVPAGPGVDKVVTQLIEAGAQSSDIVIDTGNSLWSDTIAREKKYQGKITFFSTAVSGGETGARFGPALMASGDANAWRYVKPMWNAIAAKVDSQGQPLPPLTDGEPCAAYIGPAGSGHYVKMVHNGIEYADMQLICEVYHVLRQVAGMSCAHIGKVFARWNKGVLNSYLMEISADILQQTDPSTDKPLVDMILDKAGQKGTGLWTAINSLELGCPAPTITQSVYARALSSQKIQRVAASGILEKVTDSQSEQNLNKTQLIEQLHDALYCAKVCAYAQGFALMSAAAQEQQWQLDYAEIARIWRAGCIIRAGFLQTISNAFTQQTDLSNLMLDPGFAREMMIRQLNWRKAVAQASLLGIPCPGISSALSYFDSLGSETLPANLLQAQRDYFGSHSYSRVDRPESEKYHLQWSTDKREQILIG